MTAASSGESTLAHRALPVIGRPVSPFDWTFTRDDLARVLDKIADRQPSLRLAA